jgi:hypothetical protein
MADTETFDLAGQIIAYESGELDSRATLDLFAYLIHSGQVWHLQGHYGRTARDLIDGGYLTADGEITGHGLDDL